jgi:putative lipoic acid-binding regulatory protein
MLDNEKRKVQLEYPCLWIYKIIGPDADEMRRAVAEIIRDRAYKISHSRSSETAKYHCLNVELSVESESHRTNLHEALKAHKTIKMVL